MASSFISEHSAEYILVPRLIAVMNQQFSKVVPLYFLSNREGSLISQGEPFQVVRILCAFARRPKVETINQPWIQVKFNTSLFEISRISASMGIPTFGGVPLVSSVMNFNLNVNCAWFEILEFDSDLYCNLSLDGKVLSQPDYSPAVQGPLADNQIIERVLQKSQAMEWREAVSCLKAIRRGAKTYDNFWSRFGGGYRPFTLMLID